MMYVSVRVLAFFAERKNGAMVAGKLVAALISVAAVVRAGAAQSTIDMRVH
jgi:hypothetical protein